MKNDANYTYTMGIDLTENLPLKTDSYKINHWNMYPTNTEYVESYFEMWSGALYPRASLISLQQILLRHFVGKRFTQKDIDDAEKLMEYHFGDKRYFRPTRRRNGDSV